MAESGQEKLFGKRRKVGPEDDVRVRVRAQLNDRRDCEDAFHNLDADSDEDDFGELLEDVKIRLNED
jgi:hypothetical protein